VDGEDPVVLAELLEQPGTPAARGPEDPDEAGLDVPGFERERAPPASNPRHAAILSHARVVQCDRIASQPGGSNNCGSHANPPDRLGPHRPTRAFVQRVASESAVVETLRAAPDRGFLARGLGRAYGDAAQNSGGLVLDMTALDGAPGADSDGVVEVNAGTSLDMLIAKLLPSGRFPDVVPGTRHVTIGGAIAADIHGKNHHVEGSFCDYVESFVLVTPGGERMVVEPGDDVFAATAGGMGLTGVIVSARLRVRGSRRRRCWSTRSARRTLTTCSSGCDRATSITATRSRGSTA
jgi:hypothetical protein